MRIAVSGSHNMGKTTLVGALVDELPGYVGIDEPYWNMVEEGYVFSQPPSLEDFEAQLSRSILDMERSEKDTVFDRCPVDILAYLLTHDDSESFAIASWLPDLRTVLGTLDLVVFTPIETPDRISLEEAGSHYRQVVDSRLQELLHDDIFEFEIGMIEVEGDETERLDRVLEATKRN